MKINNSKTKGERYPSVQLNKIVKLKLSEQEIKHVVELLSKEGVRIGGISQDMDGKFENYDYVRTYKSHVLPEPLNSEEQIDLFIRFKEEKDPSIKSSIRETLIQSSLRLVPYIAYKKAFYYGIEQEVLESYGYEGLIEAVENFDPYKGYKFSTYAYKVIAGFILNSIPVLNGIPRYLYFEFQKYQRTIENEYGRKLTENDPEMLEDIIDLMIFERKITESQGKTLKKRFNINTVSLDQLMEKGDFIESDDIVIDTNIDNEKMRNQLDKALDTLTEREARVIRLRFGFESGHPMTLEEVGKHFGLSGNRIRQIEAIALRKLRHPARTKYYKDFLNNYGAFDNNVINEQPEFIENEKTL